MTAFSLNMLKAKLLRVFVLNNYKHKWGQHFGIDWIRTILCHLSLCYLFYKTINKDSCHSNIFHVCLLYGWFFLTKQLIFFQDYVLFLLFKTLNFSLIIYFYDNCCMIIKSIGFVSLPEYCSSSLCYGFAWCFRPKSLKQVPPFVLSIVHQQVQQQKFQSCIKEPHIPQCYYIALGKHNIIRFLSSKTHNSKKSQLLKIHLLLLSTKFHEIQVFGLRGVTMNNCYCSSIFIPKF